MFYRTSAGWVTLDHAEAADLWSDQVLRTVELGAETHDRRAEKVRAIQSTHSSP